ncbi:unnamed protein product [Blepharisma stoltei]|uniref:Uncharacterized protein n=1 Tax=Blepharisma stoltei TaxID=1481888 RepID=A0AAU9KCA3_9CILI|nr:unnamed protein product [Blepharisma stoltei]
MENIHNEPALVNKMLVISAVVAFSASFFKKAWKWENKVAFQYWKPYETLELAARCAGLSTIIIFLQVFAIMMYRLFSSASDTIKCHENAFLVTFKYILQNLLVENFIFVVNLLSAAANGLGNERIVIVFLVFVATQILFWFGYLIISFLKIQHLFDPNLISILSFMNNAILFAFNMKPLINIDFQF